MCHLCGGISHIRLQRRRVFLFLASDGPSVGAAAAVPVQHDLCALDILPQANQAVAATEITGARNS